MKLGAYTTPLSVTSQFFFCGLPLRLDTYRGCAFQCAFCFARRRGGNTPAATVAAANPLQVKGIFERANSRSHNSNGLVGQFIRQRVPVHFGGMSDPFQPAELRYRTSEAVLRLLANYDYPTVISTRGTLVTTAPYLDILRGMSGVVVQFSLSSSSDAIAKQTEPQSFPPSVILRCMEKLMSYGIKVTCRWQPYIPDVSEQPHEFAARVAATGCAHISFEHLKVPFERNDRAWRAFSEMLGFDFFTRYKSAGATRDGREYVLPPEAKRNTILAVATEVRKAGMSFGAADNEFQHLSDSMCCCSGVDRFPGFENFFKHQIGYAIRKCRGKRVTYESIRNEWAPEGSMDRFLNSQSRISDRNFGGSTIRDHIKKRWNEVGASGSPDSFFGILKEGTTADGMNVYKWAQPAIDAIPRDTRSESELTKKTIF